MATALRSDRHQLNGDPLLLHNEGGNRNHSLLISDEGVADNKSAIAPK